MKLYLSTYSYNFLHFWKCVYHWIVNAWLTLSAHKRTGANSWLACISNWKHTNDLFAWISWNKSSDEIQIRVALIISYKWNVFFTPTTWKSNSISNVNILSAENFCLPLAFFGHANNFLVALLYQHSHTVIVIFVVDLLKCSFIYLEACQRPPSTR